jgi:uncharacterized protein DUF1615
MTQTKTLTGVVLLALLSACASNPEPREPAIDPDAARADLARRIPAKVQNRDGWAIDIFAAADALGVRPIPENLCAAVAVIEQESTFQVNPKVPGLPKIARGEIDARADSHHIPGLVVGAALEIRSPNGKSYRERLADATTEKDLSDLFQDFIGMVPLGQSLFGRLNPVRTGGPMQVSIDYAEEHASRKKYPYTYSGSIRDEVFTRRGGVYFGMAHLFDYDAKYDRMLYRFADFNAGHYASRNAAFQNAVSLLSGDSLTPDGDLLLRGDNASQPSRTELAVRKIASKLDMNESQIRRDLERGEGESFDDSRLYERVFELADRMSNGKQGRAVPRAALPRIKLKSPKITRNLTTEWFANRVDQRYQRCLQQKR